MTRDRIIIGLDIGTSTISTVVAKRIPEASLQVLGIGTSPAEGIRKGTIVDLEAASESVRRSVEDATRLSGAAIQEAYVAVGGSHIGATSSRGVVAVSRADGKVSQDDIERVLGAAQAISLPPNREIIHIIPKEFVVDGERGIKDALGMDGIRLEVEALIVHGSSPQIRNLASCVEEAGITIRSIILDPVAAAHATLSKRQQELGVVLIDIGAGTTGIGIFEEGDLIHTKILPIGSFHITSDIAIGMKIGIDAAEKLKIEYGSALPDEINKRELIDISKITEGEKGVFPRKEVAEIIHARLEEIFGLVRDELKGIARDRLLPGGAVLVGGGAKLPGVVDMAREELHLPSQLGFPRDVEGVIDRIDDPMYATAIGLVVWADKNGSDEEAGFFDRSPLFSISKHYTVAKMKRWFRAFLP